jgi:hypothetical protein
VSEASNPEEAVEEIRDDPPDADPADDDGKGTSPDAKQWQ